MPDLKGTDELQYISSGKLSIYAVSCAVLLVLNGWWRGSLGPPPGGIATITWAFGCVFEIVRELLQLALLGCLLYIIWTLLKRAAKVA